MRWIRNACRKHFLSLNTQFKQKHNAFHARRRASSTSFGIEICMWNMRVLKYEMESQNLSSPDSLRTKNRFSPIWYRGISQSAGSRLGSGRPVTRRDPAVRSAGLGSNLPTVRLSPFWRRQECSCDVIRLSVSRGPSPCLVLMRILVKSGQWPRKATTGQFLPSNIITSSLF